MHVPAAAPLDLNSHARRVHIQSHVAAAGQAAVTKLEKYAWKKFW
jgi:hypothetical protein